MTDRYLEHAISCLNRAKENPTDGVYCELSIVEVDMIIDLLKEQEAVEPVLDSFLHKRCPSCRALLNGKFCHECGQELKVE